MKRIKKLSAVIIALAVVLSSMSTVLVGFVSAETIEETAAVTITESPTEAIVAQTLATIGVEAMSDLTASTKYSVSRGDSPWYFAQRAKGTGEGWTDVYNAYTANSALTKLRYTSNWESNNASMIDIVDIGSGTEYMRYYPQTSNSMNEGTRRNADAKLYYIAEADGEYYFYNRNKSDVTVTSSDASEWMVYFSIYVNGVEKFKSEALKTSGQTAGFEGIYVDLAVGDKVEFIFDNVFDTTTFTGNLEIQFDIAASLIKTSESVTKPDGLGSIADSYAEIAENWSLPPANNRTTKVEQTQVWKAQYAALGSDSWKNMGYQYRTTNIGIDNAYANYVFAKNDWAYNRESYAGGTTYKGTANTQRAVTMYTSKYSTLTPGRKVRVAYTAPKAGNYSVQLENSAVYIRTVSGLNSNVYFAITVNDEQVWSIPLTEVVTSTDETTGEAVTSVTATAGTYIEVPEYTSLDLDAGDIVGLEMYCEAVAEVAAADDITTKFQIDILPYFNYETEYKTVITSSPALQFSNQITALNLESQVTTNFTQSGPWYMALTQEDNGGVWRDCYRLYKRGSYTRVVTGWEGEQAPSFNVNNMGTGNEYLTTYSRISQAAADDNNYWNSKHKLYYVAETSGTFYFTEKNGGFSVYGAGTGYSVYVKIYVNGVEYYKSTPLSNDGDFAVFNGIYAKLAKGDIVEYVFDHEYSDTYSGNLNVTFNPQVALLHEESYENPVKGLGFVEYDIYDELSLIDNSKATTMRHETTQPGPWTVQTDIGNGWADTPYFFKNSGNSSLSNSKWAIWGYGYRPAESTVNNWHILDASHFICDTLWLNTTDCGNNGLLMGLNFNYNPATTQGVRYAYTAEYDGTYTLKFDGGAMAAVNSFNGSNINTLENADAYLVITVNGEDKLVSEKLAPTAASNGPALQTIQEYNTFELKTGDVLAFELRYVLHEGKTIEDVTGIATVFVDPYLYYETDFETDYDPNEGVAASIGTEFYATLEEAVSAANDGDIIVLKSNVTISDTIVIDKAITLNLADYTVTSNVVGDYLIRASADLTINGGNFAGDGKALGVLCADKAVSINLRNTAADFDTADGEVFTATADGVSLLLNSVTVDTNNDIISSDNAFAAITAQNGTYTALGAGFDVNMSGKLTLDRVTVNAAGGSAVRADASADGAIATYVDCSFSATDCAIAAGNGMVITVEGGTYTSTGYAAYVDSTGGKINISSGEFEGTVQADGGEIEITSGTFDTDVTPFVVYSSTIENQNNLYIVEDASVKIYQGNHYRMNGIPEKIPATIKASVNLSPTVTGAAGYLLSNYTSAVAGTFSLEIAAGGRPKMYIVTEDGTVISNTFATDIRTGGWADIAITLDAENNTFSLYLDGVLKETTSVSDFELFAPSDKLRVGAGNGGTGFFAGKLRSLALYSEDNSLLADYSFINGYNRNVEDNSGNGYTLENLGWLSEAEPLEDYAYSFAVVGDTQVVNKTDPEGYNKIYDWIVENSESQKMEFVIGLGDITDIDSTAEWNRAVENMQKLSANNIPYSLIRGNHDSESKFNSYFGTSSDFASQVDGYYGDNLLNTYKIFKVGEMDYMIVTLDYQPTDEEIAWADAVIASHPYHNVIITTHWNMNADSTTSNGVWENLACKYENIVMVLSGHISYPDVLVKNSTGDNGNTVTQMLIDPQGLDVATGVGSTGMVAMFYFSEDGKTLQVRQYSTIQEKYFSTASQFTITLDTVEESLYGDANDDNTVDVRDMVRLKKIAAGEDVTYSEIKADLNFDGAVNGTDLTELRKKLLGKAS